MLPRDEDIPQRVCSSCTDKLKAAVELKTRINFTEKLWARYMNENSEDPAASGSIEVDDSTLLWTCHVCDGVFSYPALLKHMKKVHEPENHFLECHFCEVLLNKKADFE